MSKLKRITCYVFALLLFMQSFLVYTPVKADPPTPPASNGCFHVREGGVWKIKCTYNSTSVTFTADGDCGTALYKVQLWVSTVASKKYYLFVSANPITSSEHMAAEKIAVNITATEYDSGISSEDGPSFWKCAPLINGAADTSLIEQGAPNRFKHTDYTGWGAVFSGAAGSETAEQKVLRYISNAAQSGANIPIVAYSRTAPIAANMAACGKKEQLTQPITSITGGVEKYVADIKSKWMEKINPLPAGEDKTKAIEVVNGMLANADDLYGAGKDIELFKAFYDSGYQAGYLYPPHYPNVVIGKDTTDITYRHYADIAAGLSSLASSSNFDGRTFMFIVGPIMKAGGISMYQLDKLPLWTTGGMGAIADGTIHWLATSNVNDARNIVKNQMQLYFAHLYAKNNLTFNKCLAGRGDPFAYDTSANLTTAISNIDSILDSSFSDLTAFGTANEGKTKCDGLKGNYILVMLKQAFCGLMIITKEWADSAYNWSIEIMEQSIGLATNNAFDVGTGTAQITDPIKVGPYDTNGGGSSGGAAGGGGGAGTGDSPGGGEDTGADSVQTRLTSFFAPSSNTSSYASKYNILKTKYSDSATRSQVVAKMGRLKQSGSATVVDGDYVDATITIYSWDDVGHRFKAKVTSDSRLLGFPLANPNPYAIGVKVAVAGESFLFSVQPAYITSGNTSGTALSY